MASHDFKKPKALRQVVEDSAADMNDMQKNLGKLRALSEDDKTENAKLRSRIDEQCQLIMILKQRADEGTYRAQTLEKINKELADFREQADGMLKNEIRKFNLLDSRFNQLSSNHTEMIQIKDEYKRVNRDLREENARLKEENSKMFSKTVSQKDAIIQEIEKRCASLHEKNTTLESKFRQSQVSWREKEETLRKQLQGLQLSTGEETKGLQKRLQDAEEKLKGAEYKLQMQLTSKRILEHETSDKLQSAMKEKEELLALVMQRGKIVQKEQENNKSLQRKIEEMEKAVRNMEDKFHREAESVNANLKVQRLTEDLNQAEQKNAQMMKEYEAFKKHSNDLLKKEKELNERLRHLCS